MNVKKGAPTAGARWREAGQEDPFQDRYDCERSDLPLGHMTDDELANAVFMHDHRSLDISSSLNGEPTSIGLLTAAKERIRYLSRRLAALENSQ